MPKPSDYTPARRRLMVGVMVLILAGTIVLAGVVSHAIRRANHVRLAEQPATDRGVSVRLPLKWKARPRGGDPRVIAAASEEGHGGRGRSVEVLCERLDAPESAMQFLAEAIGAPLPDYSEDSATDRDAFPAISMAGGQGVMMALQGMEAGASGGGTPSGHVYACTITPGLRAVVVHLQGPGEPDIGDLDLVHEIAGSITIPDTPPLSATGAEMGLGDGVTCRAPSGFAWVRRNDPNRTDQLLWPVLGAQGTTQQLERNWAAIEAVACRGENFDSTDPRQRAGAAQAMLTLLSTRDARWRNARVEPIGDGQWRAELVNSSNQPEDFPCRGFLRTDASGRALLAIFHGGYQSAGAEEAWKQLSASARFDSASDDTRQLAQTGADEIAQLRSQGYDSLLAARDEQWWLLLDSSARPHVGWWHLDFDLNALAGRMHSRLRRGGGRIIDVSTEWDYRAGAVSGSEQYRASVTRVEDAVGSRASACRQIMMLQNGQWAMTIHSRQGASMQTGGAAPAAFVPGQLLPLLMGKLPDKPMILRSESFPMCEAPGGPEPLTIVIRPDKTSTPRREQDGKPLRCLIAEVNGSGKLSRWYFRADGELEHIEFCDGVQASPSDGKTIGFDFDGEGSMKP